MNSLALFAEAAHPWLIGAVVGGWSLMIYGAYSFGAWLEKPGR